MLTKPQVFYDDTHKQALGYQNPFYLKKAQRIKPTLYDGSVISSQHVVSHVFDDEETLILEEVSRSKMLAKQNKPTSKEKKVNTTPINYAELNRLSKDFDKQCFEIHKKELFLENDRLLQRIMSQDVIQCVMNSIAVFDDVNVEMQSSESCVMCLDLEAELLNKQNAYNDLSKSYSQLEKHCISLELTMQLNQEIFQKDSFSNNQNALEIPEYFKSNDLKAQLQSKTLQSEHDDSLIGQLNSKSMENADLKRQIQDKVFVITSLKNNLRKFKGKEIVENVAQIPIATMIAPRMFKIDLEPLAPRLLNNREAHIDYLKHTQEQADILQGIVKQAKAKQPLDNALDFACKHTKQIQELLVYVRDTCPNAYKPSEKLIAVTPMKKVKKVRFSEPLTSLSNIQQVESSKTPDSNTHVLSSTGLKCSTSTCRSQPTSNKKNDRISQTSSSNLKNKVEV
ncbi:hypothetical protein Tco_0047243 [Tanacetum coccineum]